MTMLLAVVVLIAAAVEGYLFGRMNWVLRIISMAGALLLIDSRLMTDLIGIAILAVILVLQKATAKNKKTPAAPAATA